ncbi:hypothetical protein F5Y04DRAFT_250504 [Hypomontagnella monticulosa]|nr:hypothetical protein F5Y04DRAFT_250504 [Hypomontagnella monticulosa]
MCFGSKDTTGEPASRPVPVQPSFTRTSISNPKASMPQDYAPPPGPPPSHGQAQSSNHYAPPPGPPPSHGASQSQSQDYAPPAGPPPSKKNNPFFNTTTQADDFAPPSGPPPSQHPKDQKQPQHDWEIAVPDTALLPPPPNFFSGFDRSPANNATEEQCEAGEAWCRQYPLYPAMALDAAAAAAAEAGNIAVYAPPGFNSGGRGGHLAQTGQGLWRGHSPRGGADTCLATYPPLYHAAAHSPLTTGRKKTAYFEVRILADGSRSDEISLAIGFVAPPYPAFRLPGWHRGSLGVHGDDGHRYINDRWGGKAFTAPFRRGETVGLGMEFDTAAAGRGIRVQVFLTRDGVESGRWDLHEETDREQDLPVSGLEGYHDLCAAVGVFDKVAFEVVFSPGAWMWKGNQG